LRVSKETHPYERTCDVELPNVRDASLKPTPFESSGLESLERVRLGA
jgi:hypothetical protein